GEVVAQRSRIRVGFDELLLLADPVVQRVASDEIGTVEGLLLLLLGVRQGRKRQGEEHRARQSPSRCPSHHSLAPHVLRRRATRRTRPSVSFTSNSKSSVPVLSRIFCRSFSRFSANCP